MKKCIEGKNRKKSFYAKKALKTTKMDSFALHQLFLSLSLFFILSDGKRLKSKKQQKFISLPTMLYSKRAALSLNSKPRNSFILYSGKGGRRKIFRVQKNKLSKEESLMIIKHEKWKDIRQKENFTLLFISFLCNASVMMRGEWVKKKIPTRIGLRALLCIP